MSRRQFLASTAAALAAGTFPSPLPGQGRAVASSPILLRAQSRVIEVGGRAATVMGLMQPDGTHGVTVEAGGDFAARLENALDQPTLIHWHGLTPPYGQDGVPDLPQPLLASGEAYDYRFPLTTPGTHWMHAHTLQEQQLLAAPLIVHDPAEASLDEQPVVVLFHDFSFRSPEELLAGLTGNTGMGGGHGGHGSMSGHGMAMDVNDVEYDAYLANDRTLDDPEVFRVERNGTVRLRLINGATATAFWIDTGELEGEAIAVDGNPVSPVMGRRFPLGMGQRIDIRLRIPREGGAWPILALREGAAERTGFMLVTAEGTVKRIAPTGDAAADALDLAFETGLRAAAPLTPAEAARRKEVVLGGTMEGYSWTLNGRTWGSHDVLEVGTGERVEIAMRNDSMMGHPMHLHGHHFQVVEIDGRRLDGAVRDTVWLPPRRALTIAFEATNPGEWAFHCHHLYHMAAGMMTSVRYIG
nr:multicopper oxidase domain-containing protein [Chelativorans alearense]